MIDYFNNIEVNATNIGNHDIDLKEEIIKRNFNMAKFPTINSNLFWKNTSSRAEIENTYENKIFTMEDGLKVGVFGLLTY